MPYLVLSATLSAVSAESRTPEAVKLPVVFKPEPGVSVRVEQSKGKIRFKIDKTKAVEVGELDPGAEMTGNKPVIIADFNFDGADDLAVLDGIGYNGVNMFYRLYLWEKGKLRFREVKEAIGNPVLHKEKSMILSAQRSGPRWYHTLYRVIDGEIYLFANAQMLNNPVMWGIVFPDKQGKSGKRAVVNAAWFDVLTMPVIPPEFSFVCDAQGVLLRKIPDKKNRMEILDFSEESDQVTYRKKGETATQTAGVDCFAGE